MPFATVAIDSQACPVSDLCGTCNSLRQQLTEALAERPRVSPPPGGPQQPPAEQPAGEQPRPEREPCGNCSPLARLTRENRFLSQRNTELVARLRKAGIPVRQTHPRETHCPYRRRPSAVRASA